MDPIEKAIRNALEKGDALDPDYRQRVYSSAENALARSLSTHPALPASVKTARMESLKRIALQVEQEFAPATADVPHARRPVDDDEWSVRAEAPSRHPAPTPSSRPVQKSGTTQLNRPARPSPPAQEAPEDLVGVSAKSNRRLSRLLIFVTFFALAVMLGWLFWTSGILDNGYGDDANPSVDQTSESSSDSGAPRLRAGVEVDEGWISVFAPSDAASLELSNGLTAELKGSGEDAYVMLSQPDGSPKRGVASVEVGRGLLETLAGKKVVFDIKARARGGDGAQMAVSCELAGMGECQRTRFRLDSQLIDNLVSVQLTDVAPEASGLLTISPDAGDGKAAIEIQSIRVRMSDE